MKRIPVWVLPVVLALLQLTTWPGLPYLEREHVSALAAATAVAVTVVASVALLWRRTAPVAVTGVIVVALTVGEWGLPTDALSAIGGADVIALYGVAVLRSQRATLLTVLGLIGWQCALVAATDELGADYPAAVALLVAFYVTVVALGRARHRWHADRARAAAELAEAEDRRSRAADTERHRLARELHDVTAHHLTSIVVIASAAQRIGASRPELVAEARDFAARTGRETLAALHRLVALLQRPDVGPDAAGPRLEELAEGFRRLGQRVTVTAGAEPAPAVAEAAYGIAREALTNTLRYAPGATVTVALQDVPGGVDLTVTDDGAATADGTVADRLGSGRGLTGMRERAEALGGSLEAGPRSAGGWQVRALLPAVPSPAAATGRRPGADRLIDAAVLLLALVGPVVALLILLGERYLTPGQAPLAVLLIIAHAAPLMWRRDRPWIVLAAAVGTTWLWPALVAVGVLSLTHGWIAGLSLGVEVLAVHAVARYGREPVLSWLSMLAVLVTAIPALTLILVLDPPADDAGESPAFLLVVMILFAGVPLGSWVLGAWLTGFLVRRRRERDRLRQNHAVAALTAWAVAEAGAERARVAAGLRAAVLRDTAVVAEAADRGDLDQVLRSARAALDGMRGLLNDLREAPAADPADHGRTPQPTLAALPDLADRWRANGRTVTLEVTGAGRALGPDVDLSAYRVVELLLAGDTGPVTVRVDLTADPLRIRVTPMPTDPGGEVAAGLRARLAAVGGALTTGASPEITLPNGEVTSSQPA
ncbi:histidine kinase [Actinoplanes sp. NPDC049681]|uniref:histidine kinase n=1 Tax=Actinoplanes sp. NPDC049681 TaxID=3363905 RepID=UPI0037B88D77